MLTQSISDLDLLKVVDENTLKTYYGCNQEWYRTERRRLSGCGPSVAATIICYLNNKRFSVGVEQRSNSKESCLSLMQEVWKYVTPATDGIPTTKMWLESVLSYTKAKGLNIKYSICDLPKEAFIRPSVYQVISFIKEALLEDKPVAFLNLCNGKEANLDSWHWVTIISLNYKKDGSGAFITILDRGKMKTVDLLLWYDTTTLGGGFVSFSLHDLEMENSDRND